MAKQKQTVKLKEPVRIRFKQLSNGNQSIYLEYYTGDVIRKENYVGGKRKYEPPSSPQIQIGFPACLNLSTT